MLSLATNVTVPQTTGLSLYVTLPLTVPLEGPQPLAPNRNRHETRHTASRQADGRVMDWVSSGGGTRGGDAGNRWSIREGKGLSAVDAGHLRQHRRTSGVGDEPHCAIRQQPIAATGMQAPIVHCRAGVADNVGSRVTG